MAVAQHGGLRRAGGAAREEQDGDGVRIHRPVGRGVRVAREAGEEAVARDAPSRRASERQPLDALGSATRYAGAMRATQRVDLVAP